MPRPHRYTPPDSVLHLVNRGNDRQRLFESDRDYDEFLELVSHTKTRRPLRLLAYCLMPNHWHMVVWPETAHDVTGFCHRLCTVHAIRRRRGTDSVGHGHIYQHRYHSFPIESERHYYQVLRYVEANPVRAGLVERAQSWRWSSLAERTSLHRGLLDPGPLPLPDTWTALVNQSLSAEDLADTRARFHRTRPVDRRSFGRPPVARSATKKD